MTNNKKIITLMSINIILFLTIMWLNGLVLTNKQYLKGSISQSNQTDYKVLKENEQGVWVKYSDLDYEYIPKNRNPIKKLINYKKSYDMKSLYNVEHLQNTNMRTINQYIIPKSDRVFIQEYIYLDEKKQEHTAYFVKAPDGIDKLQLEKKNYKTKEVISQNFEIEILEADLYLLYPDEKVNLNQFEYWVFRYHDKLIFEYYLDDFIMWENVTINDEFYEEKRSVSVQLPYKLLDYEKVIDLEGAELVLEYGNDLIISFHEKEDIIYEVIQQNSMAVVDKEAFDIFIEYIKGLPE